MNILKWHKNASILASKCPKSKRHECCFNKSGMSTTLHQHKVEGWSNFLLQQILRSTNSLLPKVSLSTSFSDFIKLISPNFANFLKLANVFLGVHTLSGCTDEFPGIGVGCRCWLVQLHLAKQ
jgi:hypothetical protein